MIYLRLFWEFFKTGLFSIGGGLATLPFLYEMSSKTGWFTHADVADMIAISESTPGAIGINMSTYAGYITAGLPGGLIATLGLGSPCVIIILIIAKLLARFQDNVYVQKALYGLRAASIAMISAACVNVIKVALIDIPAFQETGSIISLFEFKAIVLAVVLYFAMRKIKVHPVAFLAVSAVIGIIFRFGGV